MALVQGEQREDEEEEQDEEGEEEEEGGRRKTYLQLIEPVPHFKFAMCKA